MTDFTDNTEDSRFEYHVDNKMVYADYRLENKTLYIDYVEAPPALRGTGAAGKLMQYIMETAAEHGWRVVPICGYAAAWISRHPDYDAA